MDHSTPPPEVHVDDSGGGDLPCPDGHHELRKQTRRSLIAQDVRPIALARYAFGWWGGVKKEDLPGGGPLARDEQVLARATFWMRVSLFLLSIGGIGAVGLGGFEIYFGFRNFKHSQRVLLDEQDSRRNERVRALYAEGAKTDRIVARQPAFLLSEIVELSEATRKPIKLPGLVLEPPCNLDEMRIPAVNETPAQLPGSVLSGCTLRKGILPGTGLEGAIFRQSDATDADFSGADATNVDFTGAILDGATFSGTILRGAVTRCARICGTDLREAIGLTQGQVDDMVGCRSAIQAGKDAYQLPPGLSPLKPSRDVECSGVTAQL